MMHRPPADTRAWTRSLLLSMTPPGQLDMVDWHLLRFDLARGTDSTSTSQMLTVQLGDPAGHARSDTEPLLPESATLEEVLRILKAEGSPASAADEIQIKYPDQSQPNNPDDFSCRQ
jgi:hypothetical protein